MSRQPSDLAASVQARLRNLARSSLRSYEELLRYYSNERFLYRLSRSPHAERFVLKGALVLYAWGLPGGRPTRDIDLRAYADSALPAVIAAVKAICAQPVEPDGCVFDAGTVVGEAIQGTAAYPGAQVRFQGFLGSSLLPMRLDLNYSDAVVPDAEQITFPTLLGMPPPRLRGYAPDTVVAEKVQAMAVLGDINSRMKDFYDIWLLARKRPFRGDTLCRALEATFRQRQTRVPGPGGASFLQDLPADRQQLWTAFVRRLPAQLEAPEELASVMDLLTKFLLPPLEAVSAGKQFHRSWNPGGPWKEEEGKTNAL